MNKKELESEILKHQEAYYMGDPEISDEEFDALWDTLDENFTDSSILGIVGSYSDEIDSDKFMHEIHMGSQEKIRTEEELSKWLKNKGITGLIQVQEKIDGISVEIIYENGNPVLVLTRGDGRIGSDITRNIINIPREISSKERFSIRAEVVLLQDDFEEMFKKTGEETNPRNIASGIAYQKNSSDNIDKLTVICFDTNKEGLTSESEKKEWLSSNGFNTPDSIEVPSTEIDTIMWAINGFKDLKDREYIIDGVVLKQNIFPKSVNKSRPDHQRAFKWQSERGVTKIIGVEWSRSGNLYTPVALLETIKLSGTNVSRASLANLNEIKSLGLKIPSEVVLEKRGEIIPKVIKVYKEIEGSKEISPPTVCALCGEELLVTPARISCENLDCVSVLEHRIYKWIDTTGALGFGPSLLNYLIYEAGMTQIHQYYCEKEFVKALEGYNRKKAMQKSFAELWARNKMSLEDFVSGFDIPTIGSKIVKLIVDEGFDTLEKLREIEFDTLIKIEGIGDIRAKIFKSSMEELSDLMDALLDTNRVKIMERVEKPEGKKMDKVFCITGKLSVPRAEITENIESAGGRVSSTVTKNTDYLVTNDTTSGSSKNKKAEKLGVKVVSEAELYEMLAKHLNG